MNLDGYNLVQLAVLGALAVSAIGAVTLGAIWTVCGARYRWYVRASLLVALLGPLLLAPAFDLWLIFVVQAVSMVVTLAAVRGIRAGWTVGRSAWAFRLTDALALTLFAALALAPIAAQTDSLAPLAAQVTRFGVGFALLGLTGAWLAVRPWRWWGYVARAVVYLALPLITIDLLDFGDANMRQYFGYAYYWRESVALTWSTPLVVAVAARGCRLLNTTSNAPPRGNWRSAYRRGARVLTAAVSMGVVVAYVAILHDPGHPQEPMPSPNGHDEITRILRGFNFQLAADSAFQATDTQLAEFLDQTATVRAESARAVELPSVVRLSHTMSGMGMIMECRYLTRAWEAEIAAASRRGDVADMVPPAESMLLLSRTIWNGGIVVDMLIAISVEQIAINALRSSPSWPDDPRWQPVLPELLEWDSGLESVEAILRRDACWERHVEWEYRVNYFLEWLGPPLTNPYGDFGKRAQADLRLLALELALARYRALHGENPESLEQLVPELLPTVPRDPFAEYRPLAYRRQSNGYLLYSVGGDGIDNGGKFDRIPSMWGEEGYDYRLP